MSGDYTRFTHDPRRRFDGVLLQQGRVSLDADWNEAAALADERLRTVAIDALGSRAIAPDTPDAFKVGIGAGGDLTLGAGRLWVDGLAAEILPGESFSYLDQPFLREPPPVPGGPAVVWLDVWRREVTFVEEPALLDVALGGVDTATRLQTVWQVRVEGRGDAACGVEVGAPASAGRMSAHAIAPPAIDDPCLLPPPPGYRGLENRLYRVEVHEGGKLGAARFKWSRDNGSTVAAVVGVQANGTATTLLVDRLGRDPVMRFAVDDWVSVTDDARELDDKPGAMARVVEVREAERALVLDRVLADWSAATEAQLAAGHARVQRWDQHEGVDGDGLLPAAAGPIAIEAGIEVAFSTVADGEFRAGDHWQFAARVADASIAELDDAPPRGIEHHCLQLAAIDAAGVVTDCRPKPVEGDCCCLTVAPGESIQAAIDALPIAGGCVCLLAGVHPVRETVRIGRDNIALEAGSVGALIRKLTPGPALLLGTPDLKQGYVRDLRVSRIAVERTGAKELDESDPTPLILAVKVHRGLIEQCLVGNAASPVQAGIGAVKCGDLTVAGCTVRGAVHGILALADGQSDVSVVDNHIAGAASGSPTTGPIAGGHGLTGVGVVGGARRARVAGNQISGTTTGILVNEEPGGAPLPGAGSVAVSDNSVTTPTARPPNAALPPAAIDLAGSGVRAVGNRVSLAPVEGGAVVGVRLAGLDLEAVGNSIVAARGSVAVGIQLGHADPQTGVALTLGATVADNNVTGCWLGIAATFAAGVEIAGSRVTGVVPARLIEKMESVAEFTAGIVLYGTAFSSVHDNIVTATVSGVLAGLNAGTRIANNTLTAGTLGVLVAADVEPVIAGNRVAAMLSGGIVALGVFGRLEASANRVAHCGIAGKWGWGVVAGLVFGELALAGNEVRDAGMRPDGAPGAGLALALGGGVVRSAKVEGNSVTWTRPDVRAGKAEDRALLLYGFPAPPKTDGSAKVTQGGAVIVGNTMDGPGRSALIEVGEVTVAKTPLRFGCVMVANNHLVHHPGGEKGATVTLRGQAVAVQGNHVRATGKYASFDLGKLPGPFTGNVTSGPVIGRTTEFPAPAANFNLSIPA